MPRGLHHLGEVLEMHAAAIRAARFLEHLLYLERALLLRELGLEDFSQVLLRDEAAPFGVEDSEGMADGVGMIDLCWH